MKKVKIKKISKKKEKKQDLTFSYFLKPEYSNPRLSKLLFSFYSFTYSQSQSENVKWKFSEIIHKFKFCAFSSLGYEPSLCLAYPTCQLAISLGYQINCGDITVLVFRQSLFYLILGPQHKSSDASNLDLPKRNCKVLSLSEKMKVLHLIRTVC